MEGFKKNKKKTKKWLSGRNNVSWKSLCGVCKHRESAGPMRSWLHLRRDEMHLQSLSETHRPLFVRLSLLTFETSVLVKNATLKQISVQRQHESRPQIWPALDLTFESLAPLSDDFEVRRASRRSPVSLSAYMSCREASVASPVRATVTEWTVVINWYNLCFYFVKKITFFQRHIIKRIPIHTPPQTFKQNVRSAAREPLLCVCVCVCVRVCVRVRCAFFNDGIEKS